MPLSKHFGGKGASVMKDMKSRYGSRAESVFSATENKQKQKKKSKKKKSNPGPRHGGMAVGMGGY